MQITSLPATNTLGGSDVLVVEINGVTYKILASTLASMLQSIGSPLAVNVGGTGLTANPSMLTNLASTTAANVLQASPRPGVTGVLSLANGGLGNDFSAAASANAGFHNSIFRGKNLGTSYTAAQSSQVTAGTFDDLFVGDYWVINGVNWRIADFDPYYRCGDNISLGHHIAVVPDTNLYSTKWNETNDTSTGYVGSAIRANIKAASDTAAGAEEKVIAAFGSSHVLAYHAIYPASYSSGKATGWAWTDAKVELMNEVEVYGSSVWTSMPGYETGINKRQLSLFRIAPQFINIRALWWLRSVYSAAAACTCDGFGYSDYGSASVSIGVRPLSLIA